MNRLMNSPSLPAAVASQLKSGPSQPVQSPDSREPGRNAAKRLWLSSGKLSCVHIVEEEPVDPHEQELLNGY